ncbi:MAG: hypothetical protein ACK4TA_19735 [Saprospiraceae bacterium]
MQSIESKAQFRDEVQQLLRSMDEQINNLSQARPDQDTDENLNRLKNQRRNLQEALERFGNESDDNWQDVKSEAQYALEEVSNAWVSNSNQSWGKVENQDQPKFGHGNTQEQWQVSTGQSDRGADALRDGLGDRGGMEDPQFGLENTTQYSSFGNPYDEEDERAGRTRRDHARKSGQSDSDEQSQGGAGDRSDQNNEGRTRRQGNPDDWKTNQGTTRSSYETMLANDRRQAESENEELSRTNVGGDATQDDPGGSTDKEERGNQYNTPYKSDKDKEQGKQSR